MAIMHVRMMGIVEDDPVFVGDGDHDYYGTFKMLVGENGQKIPFTVYVSREDQIEKTKTDLIMGRAVLVEGILNIEFHNLSHNQRFGGNQTSYPVITSDMILICNNLYPFYTQNKESDTASKTYEVTTVPTKVTETEYIFDMVDELPF